MTRIERPSYGFVGRDQVEHFETKYGADELATALTVDDVVTLMHNGYDGQPLMFVANAHYSVPIIVSHVKEVIASAVEQGYVPAITAAHMAVMQTDDGEGAVAVELLRPDPNRRIPRHVKAADDKRVKRGKALAGKGAAPIAAKYAAVLAESRLAANGTLADLLAGQTDQEKEAVAALTA